MIVLIACEESQTVCKAFRELGHEAYSCDILECSGGHPEWHIQGDILDIIGNGDKRIVLQNRDEIDIQSWDLIIAHPPCTYLCNSGVCWLYLRSNNYNYQTPNLERWKLMKEGAEFFKKLLNAKCKYIAVENPIMHKYAVEIIGKTQDQVIQPWQFGHGETKATCLWLKNLPKLKPTNIVVGREQRLHKLPPSKDRAKLRSKTFEGIAKAMAEQWSYFIASQRIQKQKEDGIPPTSEEVGILPKII